MDLHQKLVHGFSLFLQQRRVSNVAKSVKITHTSGNLLLKDGDNSGYAKEKQSEERLTESLKSIGEHLRYSTGSPQQRLCEALEALIERYIDPAVLPPRRDPAIQLADNFAPVKEECAPTPCVSVTGTIPDCLLGGVYVRNGSNPLYPPKGGYHYFDGHGMLHAVSFFNQRDSPLYCARFTKTSRYLQEVRAGKSLFPNPLGGLEGVSGVARLALLTTQIALGLVDYGEGDGPANAGLAFHNGRLLAMSENDAPYALTISEGGDIVTLGRCTFNGEHPLKSSMTAHPKIDPYTGDLYAYSYNVVIPPYFKYFTVSKDGIKSPDTVVAGVKEAVMIHDFAVTKDYVILPENQMTFRLGELLKGNPAVVCDPNKVPRFGVFPKRIQAGQSTVQPRWFSVPDFTAFHFVNAWQDDYSNRIVMYGSRFTPLQALFNEPASLLNTLYEVELDMQTGQVTQRQVSPALLDVGQFNHRFTGRKNRYEYMCMSGPWPKFSGIAKVDLQSETRLPPESPQTLEDSQLDNDPAIAAWRKFGDGKYGSEPFFVPRTDSFKAEDEDDGYLLSYVHDEEKNVSELLVMDARSRTLETVASIRLPSRVPYGFHGMFINKQQLAMQNPFL